ncbi:hypothetical protein BGX34_001458 [Mortierella sp. NVP85]|nr:hypothetical protein BGX34_001458 [Mortierella sp. NVP85]
MSSYGQTSSWPLGILIPLRIAHQPDIVLEVVTADNSQGDSSSMAVPTNNSHAVGELSVATGSSSGNTSLARDVASLRIREIDDSQALVLIPQDRSLESALQQLPSTIPSPFHFGTEDDMPQTESLHPFQLQMDELVGRIQQTDQRMEEICAILQQTDQRMEQVHARIQQTDQQGEHTQQQIQHQIEQILQTLQQTDRQHMEEVERIVQQLDLRRQQLEESLQISQQQAKQHIEATQQKIQQLDRETQGSRQQMQDIRQQTQRQIDNLLLDVQQLNQNAQHSQKQHEQLLRQMHEMGKVWSHQDRLSPELGLQESQLAFHQFVHARHRVQAVLTKPSAKLPIPRLFIILPVPRPVVDGQLESRQSQFRLYFLCECGSHTMDKDYDNHHEVHLANHPGYGLNNQVVFINKYGPYLLAMMYMVKYGAKTKDLVVPPLLNLNHTTGEGYNIGQLVDHTIKHLKEATGYTDGDTTAHQSLDAKDLTNIQSHLKVMDGESLSGCLSQMMIQKEHYAWICSDHWRECFEPTCEQLEYEAKVNVASGDKTSLFYTAVGKLFRNQMVVHRRSLTEVDLEQDGHHSGSGILDDADDFMSLSLDFGRFTMSAKGISDGEVKDVAICIRDLSALTLGDLEFIQQCRPTVLTVLETLYEKDDDRLANILQRSPSITSLWIDCVMERCVAVIDLVKSTREKMLQGEDKPVLRIFELVGPKVKVKVSFDEGSSAVDMESCITLESSRKNGARNFIRQYGWSVKTLVVLGSINDDLVGLLHESVQERGFSRILHLDITPTSLTTSGLDDMSQVIHLSQELTYLRLSLENLREKVQMEKALRLLNHHQDRLTSLRLAGRSVITWLPQICLAFPYQNRFPVLEEFFVECDVEDNIYPVSRQWVISVISDRQPPRTPLKVFAVTDFFLRSEEWEKLIRAIDLSTMEELHFDTKHFGHNELAFLVDHLAECTEPSMPMRVLSFRGALIQDNNTTVQMFARIREMVPQVEIRWSSQVQDR